MKKLLVEMNFRLRNVEEYSIIKKQFINNGYEILNIENFNHREFKIDFLLTYFRENMLKDRYDRILFISNIEDVVLAMYRLYNFFADDFIFFIDKYNYSLLKGEIYEKISNLNSIEKENIDEIYINITIENVCNLEKILRNTNNLRYIKEMKFMKENKKKDKTEKRKVYIYNNEKIDNCINNEKEEYIELNSDEKKINIKFLVENLMNNTGIAVYYFIMKYKLAENNKEEKINISKLIKLCFEYLEKIGEKEKVYIQIIKMLKEDKIEFIWKIQICQILIMVGYKDSELLKISMYNLISNNEDFKYHYGVMIQLFFNNYMDKVEEYIEFNEDMGYLLKELSLRFTKDIQIEKKEKIGEHKKIAIVVDQLMDIKHSTAKAALDYAINIEKYIENSEVAVVVEDNFIQNEEETILINQYKSAVSEEFKAVHENYLKENKAQDIKIYYSDISKSKPERVKESINEIGVYNPDIILNMNNKYSLSMDFLARHYKSYYLSMGLINWQDNQIYNFYFEGVKQEILPKYENNIIMKTKAISFEKKEAIYNREQFGLKEDDFIMIGVSLMPEADFTEEYIDKMVTVLNLDKRIKLIIVGSDILGVVNRKYSNLIGEKIFFIKYEANLGALYQICDIYVNPTRDGGGYSLAEAMFYGLPIISPLGYRAGEAWIGKENTVVNLIEYMNLIEKLYSNKEFYKEKSKLSMEKIKEESFENSLKELFKYIKI